MKALSFLTLLALINTGCEGLKIETKEDFIRFTERVNKGNTFKKATVLLVNDIDMEHSSHLIGSDSKFDLFRGTFDGQGYAISNINITTSLPTAGLFGSTFNADLKNIVLDDTCELNYIAPESAPRALAVGGVAGYFSAYERPSSIENTVSRVSFTFTGNQAKRTYVGGIVGYSFGWSEKVVVKNSVFLGTIDLSKGSRGFYVGGISGGVSSMVLRGQVVNSYFSGHVIVPKTDPGDDSLIGGIVGNAAKCDILNCVNGGVIDYVPNATGIGDIAGAVRESSLKYCYSSAGSPYESVYEIKGDEKAVSRSHVYKFNDSYVLDTSVSFDGGKTQLSYVTDALNGYVEHYKIHKHQRWVLNGFKGDFRSTIKWKTSNKEERRVDQKLTSTLVLLPDLADRKSYHFNGWYTDENNTELFEGSVLTKPTHIYGTWTKWDEKYSISYADKRAEPTTAELGEVVPLYRGLFANETYALGKWVDEHGEYAYWDYDIPPYNITLKPVWLKTELSSAEDLREFAAAVNDGADCKGVTISLTKDIDMDGVEMVPIGMVGRPFLGTLEGNGHVISNLNISSGMRDVSLIGYSSGMTVRNLVLDASCSIESTYGSEIYERHEVATGGFAGFCYSITDRCVAENLVGMASVSKSGGFNRNETIILGGIVGYFKVDQHPAIVVNSANYGKVSYSGRGGDIYLGGVIGKCLGVLHSSAACNITNCLADNTIIATGQAAYYLDIGGVAGYMNANSAVSNSIWTGVIHHPELLSNVSIGAFVGFMKKSLIRKCYWNANSKFFFYGTRFDGEMQDNNTYDEDFNLADVSQVGSYTGHSLINSLIAFSVEEEEDEYLSRWTLNIRNGGIKYVLVEGDEKGGKRYKELFNLSSMIALLPEFADTKEKHFSGWYNDPDFVTPHTANAFFSGITLYGRWEDFRDKYTATFVVVEGKKSHTKAIARGDPVRPYLKEGSRKHYKFSHWKDTYGKVVDENYTMPAKDITFTAMWLRTEIFTAQDLVEFSNAVNMSAKSAGVTVTLENDIDFSGMGVFKPIGSNQNGFEGVFEGQGYRISHMKISTDSTIQHTGLFGASFSGTEIRNVVLDSSCSIVSTHNVTTTYIGGILGYCLAYSRECKVLNSISFASISANGISSANNINVGGIVGRCNSLNFTCVISNCAHYGKIKSLGFFRQTYIGGVVGVCEGVVQKTLCLVMNNLNNGTISHRTRTTAKEWLGIGGIIGLSGTYINVTGCVNLGEIDSVQVESYVNSISGNTGELAIIDHSIDNDKIFILQDNFWYEDVFHGDFTGANPEFNTSFGLSDGTSLLARLESTTQKTALTQTNWKGKLLPYETTWLLNEGMHNVTFCLGGKKRGVATYSSRVILAPTMVQSRDYYFKGWCLDKKCNHAVETSAIDRSMTLYAEWKKSSDFVKNIIIGSLVLAVSILLIFGAIGATYYWAYRRADHKNRVIREFLYPKVYDAEEPENSLNALEDLYPSDYERPSMMNALVSAGMDEATAGAVVKKCYDNARKLAAEGKLGAGITEDDAAAIALYTLDFGPTNYKMNPFRLINNALLKKDTNEMERVKDILYLVLSSLRKLPVVHGIELYRGIRAGISGDAKKDLSKQDISNMLSRMTGGIKVTPNSSQKGNDDGDSEDDDGGSGNSNESDKYDKVDDNATVTWNTLSSTSPSMQVTRAFLASGAKRGMSAGTLFIITNGWGYDIQPYSLFPDEAEILLEPERQFKVLSVIPADLTIVKLEMLKSPLVLPSVFGVHDLKLSRLFFVKRGGKDAYEGYGDGEGTDKEFDSEGEKRPPAQIEEYAYGDGQVPEGDDGGSYSGPSFEPEM